MAIHSRYVENFRNNRTLVWFLREDLLWIKDGVINPYTKASFNLPIYDRTDRQDRSFYRGPNILDRIERLILRDSKEIKRYNFPVGSEPIVWRLRNSDQFFLNPEAHKKKTKSDTEAPLSPKQEAVYPLKVRFCTGGMLVDETDEFMVVRKQTTVSISSAMFVLAVAMCNNSATEASREISQLAKNAWTQDRHRAELLYNAIVNSGGVIPDYELPLELKADCAISQEVEYLLYRQICNWLGVDPDMPISRKKGRPKTYSGYKAKGEFLEIELKGTVLTGRTIAKIAGFSADTDLATLNLIELVIILDELQEREATEDINIAIAFLDAVDPDWRTNVFEELEEEEEQSSDRDPYTILGVERDATPEEIKIAYRKLSHKIHPDTSELPDWIIKEINGAYEKLKQEF